MKDKDFGDFVKELQTIINNLSFEACSMMMLNCIHNEKTSEKGDLDLLIKESLKKEIDELTEKYMGKK